MHCGQPQRRLSRSWRTAEQRVRTWNGGYIAVFSAGLGRTDRTALRKRERALQLLGFRELYKGLHIRPDNIEDSILTVRKRLYTLGLERKAIVFIATQFESHHESEIHALWDTAALNNSYLQLHQQMTAWLARAETLEPEAAALLDDASAVLHGLADSVRHWYPPWKARTRAKDLAADCAPELAHPRDWRHSALLSVMRSLAIDLLQLTGLSRDQARYYLPGTGEATNTELGVRGDEASGVWGSDELSSVPD